MTGLSFTAANGTAPYSYAITAGALPPGVTLASTGSLSGTPSATGNFTFTLTATDGSSGPGAPFTVSGSYAVGGRAHHHAVAGNLARADDRHRVQPDVRGFGRSSGHVHLWRQRGCAAGVSLNPSTGVLSGTPTQAGAFSFTISATDGGGFTGSQSYSGAVAGGVVVLPAASLGDASAGTAYNHSFSASGGTPGYTYVLLSGALPAGLSLSSAGVLSGTPTVAGTFNFTVRATDSSTGTGAPFTGSQSYTLVVLAPTITLAPSSLAAATASSTRRPSVPSEAPAAHHSLSSGALPPGISLSSAGAVSGTPTTPGTYAFTITATDSHAFTGSQTPASQSLRRRSRSRRPRCLRRRAALLQPDTDRQRWQRRLHLQPDCGALPPGIALSSGASSVAHRPPSAATPSPCERPMVSASPAARPTRWR